MINIVLDVLILLTPIMYGGYDTQMKNFLDRSIPNILPFFRNYKNKVYHEVRYKNYPKIITIGYSENLIEEEKNIFFN
ncbi:hypothetical protein [Cetobacterium sp.]|uniref:hypothetical protein n=2 Tax=Cetobacterium sp. TaxID=2071632 RepID=UPI002FC685D2